MDIEERKKEVESELALVLQELERRRKHNLFFSMFPEEGPLSRFNYPKIMDYYAAGKDHTVRAIMGSNRIGKTTDNCWEVVSHATGIYRLWWKGRKFNRPVRIWVIGETAESVKNSLQTILCGTYGDLGSGMIPKNLIAQKPDKKSGNVKQAYAAMYVKHVPTGGLSSINFYTYTQGNEFFMGAEVDIILLDEEPPSELFSQFLMRIMTTGGLDYENKSTGMLMIGFTPEKGPSETVKRFMPHPPKLPTEEEMKTNYLTFMTWDDAPHLTEEQKKLMWDALTPLERIYRAKGLPLMGVGQIWPIEHDSLRVPASFQIPPEWPRFYSFDYGYTRTMALFFAVDETNDILYIYDVYLAEKTTDTQHYFDILHRGGEWMNAASESSLIDRTRDGIKMIDRYRNIAGNGKGLRLFPADKSVEAGISAVWGRMSTGRLKILDYPQCQVIYEDMARYYRKEKDGKIEIVRNDVEACDCLRYACMSGVPLATVNPKYKENDSFDGYENHEYYYNSNADDMTGY